MSFASFRETFVIETTFPRSEQQYVRNFSWGLESLTHPSTESFFLARSVRELPCPFRENWFKRSGPTARCIQRLNDTISPLICRKEINTNRMKQVQNPNMIPTRNKESTDAFRNMITRLERAISNRMRSCHTISGRGFRLKLNINAALSSR